MLLSTAVCAVLEDSPLTPQPAAALDTNAPGSSQPGPSSMPGGSTQAPPVSSTRPTLPSPVPLNSGKIYFVAPNGDDANPGSQEKPWRTIQKAADTLVAGETVLIRGGVYPEQITPRNSGDSNNEITYTAYPGETVIIDGTGIALADDLAGLFEIVEQRYLRISGLQVRNSGPFADNAGILILASEQITVENNTTFNTASSGIGVWHSQEIVMVGNIVERAGVGGGQECITVAGSQGFEVRENLVIDCQKEGIDAKDGSSNGLIDHNVVTHPREVGIYVDAWDKPTHEITVARNLVYGSVESSGFSIASEMGGLLKNIRLENNLAYHNHTYGIEVSRCCSASHPMDQITLINNTLFGNGVDWGGGMIQDNAQATDVIIRNNLVSQNLTFQIAVAADVPMGTVKIDHNMIEGYRGYEDEVYGEAYVEGEAGFLNPSAFDFHLSCTSVAIDQGSPENAPATDMDGDIRPLGKGVDIGADECNGVTYLPLIENWVSFIFGYSKRYSGLLGTGQGLR